MPNVSLDLPEDMYKTLQGIQHFYKKELNPGERVPTLEELIIGAVGETYLPNWQGLAQHTPRE